MTDTPGAARPVQAKERIASIDVLRGVALLGILAINLPASFAHPGATFFDPTIGGLFEGPNRWVSWATYLMFDEKMMSLFSLLFGAGVVLQTRKADEQGASAALLYYRRTFWLLVFGAFHGYVLWYGDILAGYALCGFWLYPLRRLSPRAQLVLGFAVMATAIPIAAGIGLHYQAERNAAVAHDAAVREGRPVTPKLERARETWDKELLNLGMGPRAIAAETARYRDGTFAEQLRDRAWVSFQMETLGYALFTGPRGGGLMLMGMAFLQLGILTAARSNRFYVRMALAGYGAGIPLAVLGGFLRASHDWDFVQWLILDAHPNYVGSLFVAWGHLAVVMLVCRSGWLGWLARPLAAVGRMAFSNYILHTLIATTLFYSWGFARFGKLDRVEMAGVVAGIWLFQLVASPLWLARFRFGPLEWLWRSLTYWKIQPFVLRAGDEAGGAA